MKKTGFSLLELLIVIALISILCVVAIPSQKFFLDKAHEQAASSQLLRAINLTRSEAIVRGIPVMLCKSADQKTCSGDWNNGYIILAQDEMVFSFQHTHHGIIHWRAFPLNRPHLQFLPNGMTNSENGTFWSCASNAENPAWAIMISQTGRARLSQPDRNGQILDDKGKPLLC